MTYDLSILIPARSEEFLAKTIQDILENSEGNTEVIVVLDGEPSNPAIQQDPRVTVVELPESIGQRAATNLACKLSNAKYVAKCDAHCAFDKGFDVKLMAAMKGHDDWTIVPVMKNLHVFNWRCLNCGDETYQGPPPEGCKSCDVNNSDGFEKNVVWRAKPSPNSSAYRFTPDKLQFKYFDALKATQTGDIAETMSLQGSFFMLTREKYWELNICDESWGGWGQQGTEVACKTWLSGGTVMCVKNTWYAHMFRTQDGFSFPWNHGKGPSQGTQQQQARKASWELFINGHWDKQVRPLSWLVERFWEPLQREQYQPDKEDNPWSEERLKELKQSETPSSVTKGAVYYTDNELDSDLMEACQEQLEQGIDRIVSVSLKPIDFGQNITLDLERGYLSMFKQILAGLEALDTDIVFLTEHDVMYHPSHFDFVPPRKDVFYYNTNVWKYRLEDGHSVRVKDCRQTSGLCAYRELLIEHYRKRVERVEKEGFSRNIGFEPGTHNRPQRIDDYQSETWESAYPNVDIRHDKNLTPSRWSRDQFRNPVYTEGWEEAQQVPGWDEELKTIREHEKELA